jgi:DNA-binding GntR family transcriptional regulator
MLQEEGLLFGEPNQRSRVAGLAGEELEMLYAARITLESLGVRLTAGQLSREENRAAVAALHEMDNRHAAGDVAGWMVAHRCFHRQMVSRCGPTVLRTINSYTAQTERYCHTEDLAGRRRQDIAILRAVRMGDAETAVRLTAEHLTGIALRGKAIAAAVQMVTR